MKIHIETERLIMRDLLEQDSDGIFELDSDKEVHTYLGNNPIKSIDDAKQIIDNIKLQYKNNGIGRWAVVEKQSGNFIGWSGFKLITDTINDKTQYYDLGYRFIKKYWGKGYATETALASLEFGFEKLKQENIYAMADTQNSASNKILKKIGMSRINEFNYEDIPHNFYKITKSDWGKCRIANNVYKT